MLESFDCVDDPIYGNAVIGGVGVGKCEENKEGQKTATCMEDGTFGDIIDNCVLRVIADLLDRSEVNYFFFPFLILLTDLYESTGTLVALV